MSTYGIVLTYQDYAALPADGKRYEIHEGELSVTPAPGSRHQRIVGNLYAMLRRHVGERGLGEVLLSPLPDLALAPPSLWP